MRSKGVRAVLLRACFTHIPSVARAEAFGCRRGVLGVWAGGGNQVKSGRVRALSLQEEVMVGHGQIRHRLAASVSGAYVPPHENATAGLP